MKKRIFAVIAVLIVLTMAIVPAFADEGQQLGNVKTSQTANLETLLGNDWEPSQDTKQWLFDNPYTIVIDIQALYTALQRDVTSTYLVINVKQYYGGDLEEATPSNSRTFEIHFEADYNNNPYEYVSVTIDNDIVSLPWSELTTTFQKYLLIPCYDFTNSSFLYTTSFQNATGIEGPNPVFMIFNNSQWQGAINGSAYDNSITAQTSYNNGFREGREEGYEAGYNNGMNEGRVADAGIELITKAVETPFNVLTQWLNFEVLGVNVLGLVMSLLAICIVVIIIKAVMK